MQRSVAAFGARDAKSYGLDTGTYEVGRIKAPSVLCSPAPQPRASLNAPSIRYRAELTKRPEGNPEGAFTSQYPEIYREEGYWGIAERLGLGRMPQKQAASRDSSHSGASEGAIQSMEPRSQNRSGEHAAFHECGNSA
ncbi:MAG TPA: hypothetical protein VKP30_27540 [Polyangiaceae bacterium]|nr:hypothetical protein [Polyangiaceae bacterium]